VPVRTFAFPRPNTKPPTVIPTGEIFPKNSQLKYFDGEENISEIWKKLEKRENNAKS